MAVLYEINGDVTNALNMELATLVDSAKTIAQAVAIGFEIAGVGTIVVVSVGAALRGHSSQEGSR